MLDLRLSEILAEKQQTYYWLAANSGVTYQTLHRFKSGKAKAISFNVLEKICRALDCEPGDLLKLSDDKAKKKTGSKKR